MVETLLYLADHLVEAVTVHSAVRLLFDPGLVVILHLDSICQSQLFRASFLVCGGSVINGA